MSSTSGYCPPIGSALYLRLDGTVVDQNGIPVGLMVNPPGNGRITAALGAGNQASIDFSLLLQRMHSMQMQLNKIEAVLGESVNK